MMCGVFDMHFYIYTCIILKLDICMCVRECVCVCERELSTAILIVPPRRTHLPVEMSATLWSHWAWCRRPDVPGTINYYPIIINGHTQYIILFRCVIVNWYITECIAVTGLSCQCVSVTSVRTTIKSYKWSLFNISLLIDLFEIVCRNFFFSLARTRTPLLSVFYATHFVLLFVIRLLTNRGESENNYSENNIVDNFGEMH